MVGSRSYYWYNLSTQSVQQADERPSEDTIGPFSTAEEAEQSPAILIEHARAWLSSEEGERFAAMVESEDTAGRD